MGDGDPVLSSDRHSVAKYAAKGHSDTLRW